MEITLETVRQTLRGAFGRESFVASFIANVVADNACPTASIDRNVVMRHNPRFVQKHITGSQELFCLIAHELMHPMFGHFAYGAGDIEGVATDMVINAVLSQLFSRPSGAGALFRKLYRSEGMEGLLRPCSQMYHSRYNALYDAFYHAHTGQRLSTGEVIQTLKVLTPMHEVKVSVLLGTHEFGDGARRDGAEAETGLSQEFGQTFSADILARMAEDFRQAAQQPAGQVAGFGCIMLILSCTWECPCS